MSEKANMLMSICLPRHHMVPIQRHFAIIFDIGPFLVLSKSNSRLPATWNSKAASYQSFAFSVYFPLHVRLTCALALRLAHASLARPRPNISAEGLHFSAFSLCGLTIVLLCLVVSEA